MGFYKSLFVAIAFLFVYFAFHGGCGHQDMVGSLGQDMKWIHSNVNSFCKIDKDKLNLNRTH